MVWHRDDVNRPTTSSLAGGAFPPWWQATRAVELVFKAADGHAEQLSAARADSFLSAFGGQRDRRIGRGLARGQVYSHSAGSRAEAAAGAARSTDAEVAPASGATTHPG